MAQHMAIFPYREIAPALHAAGYHPLPILAGTKRPALSAWQRFCAEPMPESLVEQYAQSPLAYGIGIALGWHGVVAIDIDSDDPAIIAAVREVLA
jgi:hypothetical protein